MSIMLAVQSKTIAPTPVEAVKQLTHEGWWFELKWDGVRCLASREEDGTITLINRRGDDITERFPDVAEVLATHGPDGSWILDGEVVVFGAGGKPDFNLLAKRKVTSASKARALADAIPAYFVAFDVLAFDEHQYRDAPYVSRRMVLEEEVHTQDRLVVSSATQDGAALWDFVLEQELEGIVAKRPFAPWVPNRSDAWVKFRRTNTVSCVPFAYEPGTGWAEDLVGALRLGLLDPDDPDELIDVGKVGTGFTKADRKELLKHFRKGGDCLSIEEIVVEVEYQELTPDGKLRFPSFKGVRTDQTAEDCTFDQITHTGGGKS